LSALPISALARVPEPRFQSFSDAADSVLDVIEAALPRRTCGPSAAS